MANGSAVLGSRNGDNRRPLPLRINTTDGAGGGPDRRPLLCRSVSTQSYGATEPLDCAPRSNPRLSPESFRRDSGHLNRVPEEELLVDEPEDIEDPEEIEWDLEEEGLYSGSYKKTVAWYTFVPVTSALVFALLALLPAIFWPSRNPEPAPHPHYFPFPFPELITSSALWSLAHLLRLPLYTLFSNLLQNYPAALPVVIFNLTYAVIYNLLRLAALPILRIRHQMDYALPTWRDPTFQRVWWIALGWAGTEAIVGIVQGYAQIALYRDVMVPVESAAGVLAKRRGFDSPVQEILPLSPRAPGGFDGLPVTLDGSISRAPPVISRPLSEAIERVVDHDFDQLMNMKEREELEEIYGLPVIKIPVFVSCLQRIDSIFLTLGISLILWSSYLRSPISLPPSRELPPLSSNRPFIIAFPLIIILNSLLSIMYSPLVLPRLGVHTTAYLGFLVGLGCFFAGLGLWDALS